MTRGLDFYKQDKPSVVLLCLLILRTKARVRGYMLGRDVVRRGKRFCGVNVVCP